jgi:para-aminobenzoate synthetase component 1
MMAGMVVEELHPPPDPWPTAARLAGLPHLLFLDSADRGTPGDLNRYSFVTADPVRWVTQDAGPGTFETLRDLLGARREHRGDLPPFQGGVAGLFGYGLARATERLPRPRVDEFHLAELAVGVYDWVISWDHAQNRAWLVAGNDVRAAVARRHLQTPPSLRAHPPISIAPQCQHPLDALDGISSSFTRPDFEQAVARAVEYTHAGDCFQVNLAQRLLTPFGEHPLALYGRLRARNEAPFAAYFDLGDYAIASASPERFLRVGAGGQVETRPIKGTRPRGKNPADDAANLAELLASAKDRAENVMIVDLLRNDLGKVCEYGSIRVTKVCEPRSYRTVHHLVSEVVGRLRRDATAVDLLRGAFPGGSVTGAPKIRAMEIITELEPVARGAYCGSIGYLGFDGAMDTSILIRTMTLGGGWAQFPVGAGVVADSDPAAEYDETLAKAEGMLRALEG